MTKREAMAEAKARRANGDQVRIVLHEGIYTNGGRDITSWADYEVITEIAMSESDMQTASLHFGADS